MNQLASGTLCVLRLGQQRIAFVNSLSVDMQYGIADAMEIGSIFPVEQQIMSYRATLSADYTIADFKEHPFTEKDAQGKIVQTANFYNFQSKDQFEKYLKSGGNRFNLDVYKQLSPDATTDLESLLNGTYTEQPLFSIKNCLIQSESIRITQGAYVTGSSSFVTTDPVINSHGAKAYFV